MKELPDLKQLTEEAKEALIVELWEEIQRLKKQAEKKPKKTSRNSSLPPARGFKAEVKSEDKGSEGQRTGSIGRIPPIKSVVTRVERYGCKCEGCGQEQIANVPVGMESGSPFGDRIEA